MPSIRENLEGQMLAIYKTDELKSAPHLQKIMVLEVVFQLKLKNKKVKMMLHLKRRLRKDVTEFPKKLYLRKLSVLFLMLLMELSRESSEISSVLLDHNLEESWALADWPCLSL
ncbi:uncharacterized protein LOC143234728 isoform X3 [Tachypleus tridentatus]|uniref:uncharacterized protein LOC143234728 isoform X3 n=1 Tax=Tachypleus tridentatus TaxID=6853 RepID=UPI003FD12B5C